MDLFLHNITSIRLVRQYDAKNEVHSLRLSLTQVNDEPHDITLFTGDQQLDVTGREHILPKLITENAPDDLQ